VRGYPATRVAALRDSDPRRLGDSEIVGRLGQGGMGTVYLAHDPDGRPVAVKVVRADLAADDEFRQRFRSEVSRVRQVPPFCTAEVLDADPDHESPYLVVEYVDGPSLAEVVEERGPLTAANLHALAIGVATALTAIHGAGVVHRDLKPRNVLLAPVGPKVIDFGIARAMEVASQLTRTNQLLGTVAYMAPERFDSEGRVPPGPAADVFAWGAVIAYAGTGRTPFGADSPPATAARILTQPPDLTGLAAPLRDLVALALAKSPADRPTARDLLAMLLNGDSQGAARSTMGPPELYDVARHARDASSGPTGERQAAATRLPSRAARHAERRDRRRWKLAAAAGVAVVAVAGGTLLLVDRPFGPLRSAAAPTGRPASAAPSAGAAPAAGTGRLFAWGDNSSGNLGLGTTTSRTSPAQVGTAATWSVIDAGNDAGDGKEDARTGHACGVQADGSLWCWGENFYGQLGRGDTTDSRVPARVGDATDWASIAVGSHHSCALKSTGTLWCAGDSAYGQLGLGAVAARNAFTRVGDSSNWAQISATARSTCAIRADRTLWCWGDGADYQLGNETAGRQRTPAQVAGTSWKTVGVGENHACAIRTDGTLWCWGDNSDGQLGQGDFTNRRTPTRVGSLTTWASLEVGFEYTCAIRADATLWCWGYNDDSELGLGDTSDRDDVCGAQTDGSVWCWGENAEGSLGLGDTANRSTPTMVPAVTGRVFAGRQGTNSTFVIG
jgi:alpha-tubulin suppressor-like RCC1 family protein/predicted Ser/Thr protein kinase